ncbi:MAG: hypothetical protein LUG16_03875 [Candidatus Gastranaerophilales bacterium]|nr:hypothetical protein [Candidatus Gastranaerophilales bacterium]
MRKLCILLIFFILMLVSAPVFADILPLSTKSIKYYGIGVLNMPKSYTIYQYPYKESKILREVNYENIKKSAIVNSLDMRKISYIAYVPSNNVALLTVDLNPGNNWYSVYLNQSTGETGWVYTEDENSFYTYKSLFYHYGKKYGVRMFSDLPKKDKILYSKESKDSQILEELSYPKYISFTVIRGNWLLAAVNDTSKQAKVGWFNWRNDDGTLNMFPNFKEQY